MLLGEGELFTVVRHATREAWLAARGDTDVITVGASEAAVLWGCSPYDTLASLWLKKTGRAPLVEDDSEWLELGAALEEPIAQLAAKRTGRRVENWGATTVLRSIPFPALSATLDRVQFLEDGTAFGPLEVKNRSAWSHEDWSEGPPLHVVLQVQHQLAVTGMRHGSIAVLRGGSKLEVIDVDRDDELIAMHVDKCRAFVEAARDDVPPPVDDSEHLGVALRSAVAQGRPVEMELPESASTAVEALVKLREAATDLDKRKREVENHLLMALSLGGVTKGRLPDGTLVSVTIVNRAAYQVAATSYPQLRVKFPRMHLLHRSNRKRVALLEAAQEE